MANRFSMSFKLPGNKISISENLKNKTKTAKVERRVLLMLAYDCLCPHEAGKVLHLLNRKEMAYT